MPRWLSSSVSRFSQTHLDHPITILLLLRVALSAAPFPPLPHVHGLLFCKLPVCPDESDLLPSECPRASLAFSHTPITIRDLHMQLSQVCNLLKGKTQVRFPFISSSDPAQCFLSNRCSINTGWLGGKMNADWNEEEGNDREILRIPS